MARDLPRNVQRHTDWAGRPTLIFVKYGFRLHRFRHPFETPEFEQELALCREGAPRRRARREAMVYFIAAVGGPIKIGVAVDPGARLKALQTAHPKKLRVVLAVAGGRAEERRLHRLLAAHRLEGEWFARHPDVLDEIRRLRGFSASSSAAPR